MPELFTDSLRQRKMALEDRLANASDLQHFFKPAFVLLVVSVLYVGWLGLRTILAIVIGALDVTFWLLSAFATAAPMVLS